jgi:(5-formylfuran-3-yl)methyl phosphate transaminase
MKFLFRSCNDFPESTGRYREFFSDSYKEAFNIIEKVKVGVTPGVDFGTGGEGFLRFSYANSIENIKNGLDRLEKYFKNKN